MLTCSFEEIVECNAKLLVWLTNRQTKGPFWVCRSGFTKALGLSVQICPRHDQPVVDSLYLQHHQGEEEMTTHIDQGYTQQSLIPLKLRAFVIRHGIASRS